MSEEDELFDPLTDDDIDYEELSSIRNKLYVEKDAVIKTLKVILSRKGILSEKLESDIVSNLCEFQDMISTLETDREGYYDDDVKVLLEFLKLGHEIIESYSYLDFIDVLRKTMIKIINYLEAIGYKYPKREVEKIKLPDTSRTSREQFVRVGKLSEEELKQLNRVERENVILTDVVNEIRTHKDKTVHTLSREDLSSLSTYLVQTYWDRKRKIENLVKILESK